MNNGWEEKCRCSVRLPLGGGVGRLKHEALREEMHRFDEVKNTRGGLNRQRLYCSAAMHMLQCDISLCSFSDHYDGRPAFF